MKLFITKLSAFIFGFFAFLLFPLVAYASNGSFTASNVSFDGTTLQFNLSNSNPQFQSQLGGDTSIRIYNSSNTVEEWHSSSVPDTNCPQEGSCSVTGQASVSNPDYSSVMIIMYVGSTPYYSQTMDLSNILNLPPVISPLPNAQINVPPNGSTTYSATGSFTDTDSTSWTGTVDYGDNSGIQPLTINGTNFSLNHTYTTPGTFSVTVSVKDNQGATGTGTTQVLVDGTFTASNVSFGGTTLQFNLSNFINPSQSQLGGDTSIRIYNSSNTVEEWHSSSVPDTNCPQEGSCSVTGQASVSNPDYSSVMIIMYVGSTPYHSQTMDLSNTPPTVNSFSGATINEGDTYSASGSFTDPDSTSWTATINYGDDSGSQSLPLSGTNFSLSHVYKDNGTYTVTVHVTDNQGATGTGTATVTVNNVNPSVGTITAPSSPVLVNTAITASANFTDPGVLDTHIASWNWGDGSSTGTVTESNGSGSVSNNHTYTATGVYTITLTVTDKDGGVGTSTYQYVAVYDSSTSFAGGRSFDNPSTASPNTAGKVTFGISAKYNNSNVLTGSAKMDFKAANLDFASTSLSSLATSNGKAYLKGSGTLNGSSGYTFLETGIDGSVAGGNDLIRFQIKDASNTVVYDSQPGAGDTDDPTTVDATGNIRVH